MNPPPFELFEVLIAAAESKNYSEAARKLGLSQGSVSLKLKLLQESVALRLFAVQGKKNVLTHYGREVYDFAKRNSEQIRIDYQSLNRKYATAENLSLTIGCRRELLEKLAPKFMFGGQVIHKTLSAHEATLELLERKIDIAITYEKPNLTEIMAKKVLESSSHLIVHQKFLKGLGKGFLRSKEFFKNTPCILYSKDGHLLSPWIEQMGMKMNELKPLLVTEDWRTLQILVDQGSGYAVVPDYIMPQSKEVEIYPLSETVLPKTVFYAVFYRDLLEVGAVKKMMSKLLE